MADRNLIKFELVPLWTSDHHLDVAVPQMFMIKSISYSSRASVEGLYYNNVVSSALILSFFIILDIQIAIIYLTCMT